MNISIKATHLDLTGPLKDYVNEKISHLGKFIVAREAKTELERDRHHRSGQVFRAEVTMLLGSKVMRAEATAEDIYAAIDLVIPKLKEQISKFKDKRQSMRRKGARSAKSKV